MAGKLVNLQGPTKPKRELGYPRHCPSWDIDVVISRLWIPYRKPGFQEEPFMEISLMSNNSGTSKIHYSKNPGKCPVLPPSSYHNLDLNVHSFPSKVFFKPLAIFYISLKMRTGSKNHFAFLVPELKPPGKRGITHTTKSRHVLEQNFTAC